MCIECGFVHDESPKNIAKGTPCIHFGNYERGYTTFPNNQSTQILGGMVHFVDSYNEKITSDRHIFPPQVYLPVIFATSNYETVLHSLVIDIMKRYGSYIGRLTHFMLYSEVLSRYDKKTNESLFKALTQHSVQESIQTNFPNYFNDYRDISKVRNKVVHGKNIDDTEVALTVPNQAINFMLETVDVFKQLHNDYVVCFNDNVDYRTVLRLNAKEDFNP